MYTDGFRGGRAGSAPPLGRWTDAVKVLLISENQTWSSRDLSLGLETSRDPFLQVLVSVLEPQSLGLGLGLGTSESWSRSWSWNPPILISVSVLGLETVETRSSSLMKRETETR